MIEEPFALSVSELNEYVRKRLASDPLLRSVSVRGEISGYKHHVSGHRYFSLKDQDARVQCVMFRQQAQGLKFLPRDGMRVTVTGAASLFVRDGSYQLYAESMREEGVGDLYLRFEQLKQKLMGEGLFDPARKREIPAFPKTLGVVTSKTGAVVHDILKVSWRRNPNISVLVSPCAVQGPTAAREIVEAIQLQNAYGQADVLLVGRGGGSMEDLFCFNEEIVARAIAASKIPVISCVGHETDFTIADFTADLRAPTPSAAAELAVPEIEELRASMQNMHIRLGSLLKRQQELKRARLNLRMASPVFQLPGSLMLDPKKRALQSACDRAQIAVRRAVNDDRAKFMLLRRTLEAIDPKQVLVRGYAYVERSSHIVESVAALAPNDPVRIVMRDGRVNARVEDIEAYEVDYGGKEDDV